MAGWQKQPLFLLFPWNLPLLYLNVEKFLLLKAVTNDFQSKNECVCVYPVAVNPSKGTVL